MRTLTSLVDPAIILNVSLARHDPKLASCQDITAIY